MNISSLVKYIKLRAKAPDLYILLTFYIAPQVRRLSAKITHQVFDLIVEVYYMYILSNSLTRNTFQIRLVFINVQMEASRCSC